MHLPLDDSPNENILKHFEEAHKFINNDVTLVHCYAGISRSATIVISYLIKYHNMSLVQALEYCRSIRPIVNPNKGFMLQLIEFEKNK
jgi:protein-tyrosine phosphatase